MARALRPGVSVRGSVLVSVMYVLCMCIANLFLVLWTVNFIVIIYITWLAPERSGSEAAGRVS